MALLQHLEERCHQLAPATLAYAHVKLCAVCVSFAEICLLASDRLRLQPTRLLLKPPAFPKMQLQGFQIRRRHGKRRREAPEPEPELPLLETGCIPARFRDVFPDGIQLGVA